MLLRTLTVAALLVTVLSMGAASQNAGSVVAAASKAMGADTLNSITYTGTARNGAFGQSKAIGTPLGPVNVTQITTYTRTINFGQSADRAALISRATGPTMPPTVPGTPAPMPGVFNQNITGLQNDTNWTQALNIWTTPWGFLKGAAANNATVGQQSGQQVVSFSPPTLKSPSGLTYTVTGYINNQNLVTKVETRVEQAVVGDLLVEFDYSNYRNMNGVQVPGRIVQRQAGLETFNADITAATANPANLAELLTPPAAPGRGGPAGGGPPGGAPGRGGPGGPPPGGGGGAQQAAAPPVEKLGDGVFKIGGNYVSLAVDMGDHTLVVESGQSDARGMAVMAAAKQAIPNKPIRFVVNSHPHFDHASGLAAAVAEGATILTHTNNEPVLERLLAGPRTLMGDSLSKISNRRTDVVSGVGDRDVRRGTNGKVVELHRIPNEHSDGMLAVYLPAEKALWTADITAVNPNPAQLGVVRSTVAALTTLNLDFNAFIPAHPPNPDRPLTKADLVAAAGVPVAAAQEQKPTGSKIWIGRNAEFEEALRTQDIERTSGTPVGVLAPRHAHFKPGGLAAGAAVKPFPPGKRDGFFESYKSEIAAYKLDRLLDLNMVPPTVERRYEGRLASAQLWIENTKMLGEIQKLKMRDPNTLRWNQNLHRAQVFDLLVGNIDPNQGNWLFDEMWNYFKIDCSRCFTDTVKMVFDVKKTIRQIDRPFFERIKALDRETVRKEIGDLLTENNALGSLFRRRDSIVKDFEDLAKELGEAQVFVEWRGN